MASGHICGAVDDEGEVLEVLAQSRRNKRAALKLMRKILKKQGNIPDEIITDKLRSYSAALRERRSHDKYYGGLRIWPRTVSDLGSFNVKKCPL